MISKEQKREVELIYLLTEAVSLLAEQEQPGVQPTTAPPIAPQQSAQPSQQQMPMPAGSTGEQPEPFTVDQLIDKLNIIRGGKSFSNPEVYKSLSAYFNVLPANEKEVLDRTLTGLSKAVINAPDGGSPETTTPVAGQPSNQMMAQQPTATQAPAMAPQAPIAAT